MLTQPYHTVIEFINKNPNNIYVWVKADPTNSISINISKDAAIRWCDDSKQMLKSDMIAVYFNNDELFLGFSSFL